MANKLPYEIRLTPNPSLRDLRKLIIEVKDEFITRFNELNLDNDYDILCDTITLTFSHIKRRVCEPSFYVQARAENASEYVSTILSGGTGFLMSSKGLLKETHR